LNSHQQLRAFDIARPSGLILRSAARCFASIAAFALTKAIHALSEARHARPKSAAAARRIKQRCNHMPSHERNAFTICIDRQCVIARRSGSSPSRRLLQWWKAFP
jgi:hypothetical protein